MAPQDLIAVTGATGVVGGRVAARLAEAGVAQRLVVRDPGRAPEHPGAEVRRASGYGAAEEMRAALDGAATLFLVPAAEAADRVEQHKVAVDAAAAAGVRRIVYLSFASAASDATFTLARHHWATEEHIRSRGLAFTFLRMNLYMDFIPSMIGADGAIRGPAGDGRVAAILRDDVAAAAAAVLATAGHDGRTYDSPAGSFSSPRRPRSCRRSGTTIRYHDETDEEALPPRGIRRAGLGDEGWVSSYQAVRDGALDDGQPPRARLVGREPLTLAEYLETGPELPGRAAG